MIGALDLDRLEVGSTRCREDPGDLALVVVDPPRVVLGDEQEDVRRHVRVVDAVATRDRDDRNWAGIDRAEVEGGARSHRMAEHGDAITVDER